uniref:Protein MAIN-LIKE 2-like n=1 Tax=Cicer arietinum TaxID=3827 RepID=A0A3Q7YB99_CICAR|nr:protein MAIN-LIKE 2-like [Cicer arietinum]
MLTNIVFDDFHDIASPPLSPASCYTALLKNDTGSAAASSPTHHDQFVDDKSNSTADLISNASNFVPGISPLMHDRGPLKVITHGLKLKKFSEVPVPHPVEHWIRESGLLPLCSAYLTIVDAGLVSAFVERWHMETSSFHLPFEEMTITLDDVATLHHISPNGKFFDAPVNMNTNNAARAAHEYLGATWEESLAEINFNKCAQYRLQWLRDLYSRLIQTNQFECAARTYLLHLVGSTIFADKTHTRVEAKYISLFVDLDRCRHYSWAAAALVFLYDNMGDGAVHDTRQLGGYMTLLQCWIYEHFPRICKRDDRGAVPAHLPRACKWIAKHADQSLYPIVIELKPKILRSNLAMLQLHETHNFHQPQHLLCPQYTDNVEMIKMVALPLQILERHQHTPNMEDHEE